MTIPSLLTLAIMPPVLIIWYVRSQDRTPEDLKFLLKLFFGGVTSCVLTLLITLCLVLFKIYIDPEGIDDLLMNIFVSFIFVGLIEEFSKFIFVYFIGYRKKKIKEFYDIIVRSSFVAIGFAAFENIFYVLGAEYSIAVGIGRAISAVPFHAGLGIMMGYYLGLARINKINHKQKLSHFYFILALLVPALFHGIYDGILFYLKATNSNYAIIFVLAIIILTVTFFIYAFMKIKRISKSEIRFEYEASFCPRCGTKLDAKFCPKCGFRRD